MEDITNENSLIFALCCLLETVQKEIGVDDLTFRSFDHGEWGIIFSGIIDHLNRKGELSMDQCLLIKKIRAYFGDKFDIYEP
jgi:hypothetical protein